VDSWPFQ